MAPLPPETTARLWVDYSVSGHQHSQMWRYPPSLGAASFQGSIIDPFLTALAPLMALITIVGVRIAATGSTVSFPIASSLAATYGSSTQAAADLPLELCFVGRSDQGRRTRIFIYGYKGTRPADFRLTTADDANISNAWDVLDANKADIIGIDGRPTTWHPYADVNFNSYWERKLRS